MLVTVSHNMCKCLSKRSDIERYGQITYVFQPFKGPLIEICVHGSDDPNYEIGKEYKLEIKVPNGP